MSMEKHCVVISRRLQNGAPIRIDVSGGEIAIAMSLQEFLDNLVVEAGNPTLLVTQAGLRTRLEAAATKVCDKMKQETVQVM